MALTPNGIIVKSSRCPDIDRYGLLSVAETLRNVDPHWMASGFEFEDFLCSSGVIAFTDECPPITGFTKPAERTTQFCHVDPFVVLGSYKCPPVGRPQEEAYEIARQRLLKWEGHQVETVLWTGVSETDTSITPSFAFGNPSCDIVPIDVNPAGAVDPVAAVSLLEESLGEVSGCGVIHIPYRLGAYFKYFRLLEKDGDAYYTPTGFKLVLGHGYPGSGPGNVAAAAGELWVFGTGPVALVRSDVSQVPVNLSEAFNRQVNDVEYRAERFYAVGFSCALFAVRVDLCNLCV